MSGRMEKEKKAAEAMDKKLETLPDIFTLFYNWMNARDKTYTTMNNYINHVVDFMNFFTKGKNDKTFYERVTDNDIEKYMISIRIKIVNFIYGKKHNF